MKQKLSISIEQDILVLVDELVKTKRFRNKSHVVEYSLQQFLEAWEHVD